MHPVLFTIGKINIYSYGFMLAVAFLFGLLLTLSFAKKEGIEEEKILDIAIWVIVFSIVGSRLLFVLLFFENFKGNLLEVFMIQRGGLVFYGGFLLATLAVIYKAKVYKLNLLKLFDSATPGTALGYSIARIGCFLNGCCYGKETNFFLSIKFPNLSGLRHPTQIYSSAIMFIIFLVLLYLYRKKSFNGQLFFTGILFYSIYRFLIEFLRFSPTYYFGLTPSQIISIFAFVFAIYFLFRRSHVSNFI